VETDTAFWQRLDDLVAAHDIVIDRPRGMPHPRYPESVYPLDYGYLAGTSSPDGGSVDLYVGSSGLAQVDGVICTVDLEKHDVEIKILFSCTAEEMQAALRLANTGGMAGLLIPRRQQPQVETP
jgi:inorganic pyrophosphatase